MSNNQNNETKASAAQPRRTPAPDGKSKLPDTLPDFPGDPTNGGPTHSPAPK